MARCPNSDFMKSKKPSTGHYRSRESHLGKTPEARAAQLANLRMGRRQAAKVFPEAQKTAPDPRNNPFDACYKEDPIRFIEDHFYLTPERRRIVLDPWQKDILTKLFQRDQETGKRLYTMAVISAPKKCGKTSLAAAIIMYVLVHGEDEGEIILAASAEHQSTYVVFKKLRKSIWANRAMRASGKVNVQDGYIENTSNGTTVRVVPVNAGSVAGLNPSLVLFDELHAYKDTASNLYRDFYDELTVSPTRQDPLTLITSYAGTSEDSLLYEIYQKGLAGADPRMLFFWSHDPYLSPRTTPDMIEDKRRKMHPNSFARLFENRWTQGESEFISTADYDKCVAPDHAPMFEDPGHSLRVYLGIDIGVKSDCSAVVAVARQGDKIALLQHRLWRPMPNDPVDIRDVEAYILELKQRFRIVAAHFDPSQFLEGSVRLAECGINTVQFTQSQNPLIEMAQNLFQLIKSKTLKLYNADDLREHFSNACIKESAKGFQIVKGTPSKKIDLVVALAMACQACTKERRRPDGWLPVHFINTWKAW